MIFFPAEKYFRNNLLFIEKKHIFALCRTCQASHCDAQMGRSFYFYSSMIKKPYAKPPLSVHNQIKRLKSRGLLLKDEAKAEKYLRSIGYFRLSAYFYPLLKEPKTDHRYKNGTSFTDALNMYRFDRKLRLLIFSQIEKIEIAVRASIVRNGVEGLGSVSWFLEERFFSDKKRFEKSKELILKEWDSSKEDFIEHFKESYTDVNRPVWMLVEVLPLGVLSNLYMNIGKKSLKKTIAKDFGLPPDVFSSWLQSLSGIRNICCHHNRLWNRLLPNKPKILGRPIYPWIDTAGVDTGRTYYKLAMIRYILISINPNNRFTSNLKALCDEYPTVDLAAMGFPSGWASNELWSI